MQYLTAPSLSIIEKVHNSQIIPVQLKVQGRKSVRVAL